MSNAVTLLDPLGRAVKETDDASGRLLKRELYSEGRVISSEHFDYDAGGRLCRRRSTVMDDGMPIRGYAVLHSFNRQGLIESETEMPRGATTRFVYDAMGRLLEQEKVEGVKIIYSYNPFGKVQTLSSSDGTIDYAYTYDGEGNLIQIEDRIHGLSQKRSYDQFHRLLQEEISPGIILHYTYDSLDRITRLELPDRSSIAYTYDAFHLRKIERSNSSGKEYQVECSHYDLRGNLLSFRTPAGKVTTVYDLLERPVSIQSPHWECRLESFDGAGNLLKMKQKDPGGWMTGTFAYDRFNHLSVESSLLNHTCVYDSLGNCLRKDERVQTINELNQLVHDGALRISL